LPTTAERDALVERHVVADLRRLADDDPGAVVDEEPLADPRRRMDLDPGPRAREHRQRARRDRHPGRVQAVRDAMAALCLELDEGIINKLKNYMIKK